MVSDCKPEVRSPEPPSNFDMTIRSLISSIPAHLPHDFVPGPFRTETEIPQHTPRHPVTFQDQAEQDMFGSDRSIPADLGFPGGKVERFLDTRSVWNLVRHFAGWKSAHPILDLPSYAFTVHSH